MSIELNSANRVKSPTGGLPGDEFYDAEDGGKLGFIYNISSCRAVTTIHFGDLDIRAISPLCVAYRDASGSDWWSLCRGRILGSLRGRET